MKILYLALTLLICIFVFGQLEQNVNKTSGTETNLLNDIDSIRFNGNQTEMLIILNNGNTENHSISDINNVTFSGQLIGQITSLDCSGATINGTLVEGVTASGVSADIDYTGGNTGSHNGQTVNSTGVTGLTATLNTGSFVNGTGTLNYTITGTPNSNGLASFAIQIGGQSCSLQVTVDAGAISSLDCSGATVNGTLVEGAAASGVSADIDYTGGNTGPYNGQTVNSTGVTGLTATLSAGNFVNGSGTLNYTITGTPNSSGTASFAIAIGGQNCTLDITVDAAPLAIGDYHQGGVVFYLDGNGGGLICAIEDQGTTNWGCYGTYIGTTGTAIGTGTQNTMDILNEGCVQPGTSAAEMCDNYTGGGYTDWFLPSKDELYEMWQNKAAIDATAIANGGSSFVSASYWSSSESSGNYAWDMPMYNGIPDNDYKNSFANQVRAIRAF